MYTYRLVFMTKEWMKQKDYDNIDDIMKTFTVIWMEKGRPWTWLEGKEYPKIHGFLWGMRDGGNIIRYESREVYDILST